MKDKERQFNLLKEFDTSFGQPIWSSGLTTIPAPTEDFYKDIPVHVDLALIKVDDERLCMNELPKKQSATYKVNGKIITSKETPGSLDTAIIPIHYSVKDSTAQEELIVMKYGRTTRVTEGIVGFKRFISTRQIEGERWADHIVFAKSTYNHPQWPLRYSEGGDSGAPVFTHMGEFIGMHFAGSDRRGIMKYGSHKLVGKRSATPKFAEEPKLRHERDIGMFMTWDTMQRAVEGLTEWKLKWVTETALPFSGKMLDEQYMLATGKKSAPSQPALQTSAAPATPAPAQGLPIREVSTQPQGSGPSLVRQTREATLNRLNRPTEASKARSRAPAEPAPRTLAPRTPAPRTPSRRTPGPRP